MGKEKQALNRGSMGENDKMEARKSAGNSDVEAILQEYGDKGWGPHDI